MAVITHRQESFRVGILYVLAAVAAVAIAFLAAGEARAGGDGTNCFIAPARVQQFQAIETQYVPVQQFQTIQRVQTQYVPVQQQVQRVKVQQVRQVQQFQKVQRVQAVQQYSVPVQQVQFQKVQQVQAFNNYGTAGFSSGGREQIVVEQEPRRGLFGRRGGTQRLIFNRD